MKCHINLQIKRGKIKGNTILHTEKSLLRRPLCGMNNIQRHANEFIQRTIVKGLLKSVFGGKPRVLVEKKQSLGKRLVIDVENKGIWLSTTKTEIKDTTHPQTYGLYVNPVTHTFMVKNGVELTLPLKEVVSSA